MNRDEFLAVFYASLPDTLTIVDCAKGIDHTFTHEGKTYSLNTRAASGQFMTRPMDEYYQYLESKVLALLEQSDN